jgi:large subunit ribosomal protein L6
MSRIGKQHIEIPQNVTVELNGSQILVKGPKGELSVDIRPEMSVKIEENILSVVPVQENKNSSAYWGLTRALINNMIIGVTEGYEKRLELVGVGYRAKQIGNDSISLSLGFSHPVEVKAPESVTLKVEDEQHILISGPDKQLVGLSAANIRKLRKPEPYKGKGIRYEGEFVRRKAGKTGKV